MINFSKLFENTSNGTIKSKNTDSRRLTFIFVSVIG